MEIYCSFHNKNEHLSIGQVERLLYALIAVFAESDSTDKTIEPVDVDYDYCILVLMNLANDVEEYYEWVNDLVNMRRKTK